MSNLITLEHYNAETAHYHAYECASSRVSQMPHYHDYYQIVLVISGEAVHSQGGDSVSLLPGDAFIVPPGFVHTLRFLTPDTRIYLLAFSDMLFHGDFLQSNALRFLKELQTYHDTGAVHLALTPRDVQRNKLEMLLKCLIEKDDTPPELSAVPNIIGAVIYILAQCYYSNPGNNRHPWDTADNAQVLRRCLVYVDTHYTQSLTPDTLAKQFGLSRSVLCSAFQQHTGLPLHKYIAHKRIHRAQILIRTQDSLPLTDIAAAVGYEDNSTFYRNFVKIAGMSPAKYRELCSK